MTTETWSPPLALIAAVAHLGAVRGSCTPETWEALDVVLEFANDCVRAKMGTGPAGANVLRVGDRVRDVETSQEGTVVERVTLGQLDPDRPPYPHVYDVAYDDGATRRRMAYHLSAVES